jgi:uncharacterized protein YndB with AHSA1/START domain
VRKEVKTERADESTDRVLVVTRVFDAPRELVFEAFTTPRHLMSWWGPQGCSVISCEADPRVGGTWRISMRSPKVLPQFTQRYATETSPKLRRNDRDAAINEPEWIVERQRGVYQEVIKPERLVFTYAFEDGAGRPRHQTVVTITFAAEGGRTRLTIQQATFESSTARNDHVQGWTEALDRLLEYLVSVR